jgi:uncharacterized protein YjiS (DUF1127 family)
MSVIRTGGVLPRRLSGGWSILWLGLAVDELLEWRRRQRSRRQIQAMSDHMCKDIGVSRVDIQREAEKPFWKA